MEIPIRFKPGPLSASQLNRALDQRVLNIVGDARGIRISRQGDIVTISIDVDALQPWISRVIPTTAETVTFIVTGTTKIGSTNSTGQGIYKVSPLILAPTNLGVANFNPGNSASTNLGLLLTSTNVCYAINTMESGYSGSQTHWLQPGTTTAGETTWNGRFIGKDTNGIQWISFQAIQDLACTSTLGT